MRKWLGLMLSILLSGCGFHLRTLTDLPPHMQHLCFASDIPYATASQQLSQMMRYTNTHKDSCLVLRLLREQFTTQATTARITIGAQYNSVQLHYRLTYRIEDAAHHILFGPRNVDTTTSYIVSANQLLASQNAQTALREQLTRDAVNILFLQLSANEIRKATVAHHEINSR